MSAHKLSKRQVSRLMGMRGLMVLGVRLEPLAQEQQISLLLSGQATTTLCLFYTLPGKSQQAALLDVTVLLGSSDFKKLR